MPIADHNLPSRLGANLPEGIRIVTAEDGCRATDAPGGYQVTLSRADGVSRAVFIPDGTPDPNVLEIVSLAAGKLVNQRSGGNEVSAELDPGGENAGEPVPASVAGSPVAPESSEKRFLKQYPCGCVAGPGPEDMPDYCAEHGAADDTSGVVTVEEPATPEAPGTTPSQVD